MRFVHRPSSFLFALRMGSPTITSDLTGKPAPFAVGNPQAVILPGAVDVSRDMDKFLGFAGLQVGEQIHFPRFFNLLLAVKRHKNLYETQHWEYPLTRLATLDLQMMYQKLLTGGRVERLESQNQPKGLSAKTVRNLNQIISSAMKLAMEQKLIAPNPADSCACPAWNIER